MNKTILIGLSVTIMVMFAAVLILQDDEAGTDSELFAPVVSANLDDITRVEIRDNSEKLVMTRGPGGDWLLQQAHNYFVDIDRLTVFLRAISTAQTVEEKTAKPEYYSRLGVDDVSPDGASVEVGLFWADQQIQILFGNTQGSYRFARVSDQPSSWLIDTDSDLSSNLSLDATDWLVSELINIMETEVLEVNIEHSDSESITLVRGEDGEYSTDDIPEGRELSYATILNSFGGALFRLDFDQVRSASDYEVNAVTTFHLSDGTRIAFTRVPDGEEEDVNWFGIAILPTEEQTTVLSAVQMAALEKAVEGWEFQFPAYKADQIVQRMEDLLSAVE